MKFLLLVLAFASTTTSAAPLKTIQRCVLEDGSPVELLAQHMPGTIGDRFLFMLDGQVSPAFPGGADVDYTGDLVLATCVNKVLVFAMNYGAPYYKGVVIRRMVENREMHRIDFAEKALPAWLYLGPRETKLIIPDEAYEAQAGFLVYRYESPQGQHDEIVHAEKRPPEQGFRIAPIKRQAGHEKYRRAKSG